MGRGRGRGKRRDFNQSRDGQWGGGKRQRTGGDGWAPAQLNNALFEEYYKEQGICAPEEFEAMLEALRKPLPTTFRINGSGKFADDLRDKLEADFFSKFTSAPIRIEGDLVEPPKPLPWYPHKLAWQFNFSRSQLRKLPVLEALHEFIKRENELGAITRQEAVSMVPPLFLDVGPSHRVLDMCAAPGSKTFQLLEMLHAGPEPATGLVIANDADNQRCNLLTHQTKRMCSPALLITNHEAQNFPLIRNYGPNADEEKFVLFDRILCDVPCSGDGTMRKAPDIWRRWGVGNGNGLHSLQLRITLRACELLRVGGRLVYSTCTFNPIEDEAVVAEVLRRTKGAFQLLDVSDRLPELKRLPGLQRWRVRDRDGWYDSWEQGKQGWKLDPTMFPDEASDAFPLSRCMRFLPHHQDTGGFFVAVLEKVAPLEKVDYPSMDHRSTRAKEKRAAADASKAKRGEAPAAAAEGEAAAGEAAAAEEGEGGEVEMAAAAEDEAAAPEAAAEAAEGGAEAAPAAAEEAGAAGEQPQAAAEEAAATAERGAAAAEQAPVWGGIRGGGARNRQGGKWAGVDPIVPFLEAEHLASLQRFYGLPEDCPVTQALISRSEEKKPKRLYLISNSVKELLTYDSRELLKVTTAGIKVFERQEDKEGLLACSYRIAQDGLPSLLPYITRQRFQPTLAEFISIITDRIVRLPDSAKMHITKPAAEAAAGAPKQEDAPAAAAAEAAAAVEAPAAAEPAAEGEAAAEAPQQGAQQAQQQGGKPAFINQAKVDLEDADTLRQMEEVDYGCCVATLRDADASALGFAVGSETEGALAAAAPLAIACWRGRGNLNVLVSKQECAQMAAQVREAQAALEAKQQQQQQQPAAGDAKQGDEAVEAAVVVEVETKQE